MTGVFTRIISSSSTMSSIKCGRSIKRSCSTMTRATACSRVI